MYKSNLINFLANQGVGIYEFKIKYCEEGNKILLYLINNIIYNNNSYHINFYCSCVYIPFVVEDQLVEIGLLN